MIEKATRKKQKLRLLIEGAAGSGKTMTALKIAKGLVGEDAKIVVLDTENGSASLYSDRFDFYTTELKPPYSPQNYILKIKEIEKFKADLCIIDSMSMVWSGQGGCLDIQTGLGGRFQDWAKVTPQYEGFMNAILQSPMHIICTARTKTDWSMDKDDNGKTKVEKLGLKTEARDGTDYTFTTVFRLNQNHYATCSKDRTSMFDNLNEILDEKTGIKLKDWLEQSQEKEPIKEEVKKPKKEAKEDTIIPDDVVEIPFETEDKPKEKCISITPTEILETSDNDILNLFKDKCIEAGLKPTEIKFFGKRNNINPKDVNSIINFLKDNDLAEKVQEFKDAEDC